MVYLGSDNRGLLLKEALKDYLKQNNIVFEDVGGFFDKKMVSPQVAYKVANLMKGHDDDKAILICGSGISMSVYVNKYEWIRAAVCTNPAMAKLSVENTGCNVLCLGGLFTSIFDANNIVKTFLETKPEIKTECCINF